jgi:hypothetical protein
MPLVDAYLAGTGDLEAAAAELIRHMPLHGSLFGGDPDAAPTPEVEQRGRDLMARVSALLAQMREDTDNGTFA